MAGCGGTVAGVVRAEINPNPSLEIGVSLLSFGRVGRDGRTGGFGSILFVVAQRAVAFAQCNKNITLVEKRTRLFLALLATFGGRPGDISLRDNAPRAAAGATQCTDTPSRYKETSKDKQPREEFPE